MTWGEFKKALDKEHVADTDIISFIDVDLPSGDRLEIRRTPLRGSKTLIGLKVTNYE